MCLNKDPVVVTEWKYTTHLTQCLILVSLAIFTPTEKNRAKSSWEFCWREWKKKSEERAISLKKSQVMFWKSTGRFFSAHFCQSWFHVRILSSNTSGFSLINTFNLSYINILLFSALEPILPSLPFKSFCFVRVWFTISYKIPSFM